MADARYWTKEALTSFIELYKSYPCLWKIKSKEYTNRNLKNDAYDKLVAFCKAINPEANRDYVVKKIQSFRGSFRKELKKMEESKRSGAGADEVYAPTLWYFDSLLFTIDQELPTPSISNITESETDDETQGSEIVKEAEEHDGSERNNTQTSTEVLEETPSTSYQPPKRVPTKRSRASKQNSHFDFINYCKTQIEKNSSEIDEFDAAAIAWGKKIKRMNPTQAIYADMLINNIINQGLLNQLSNCTTIVHRPPEGITPSPSFSPSFSPFSPGSSGSSQSAFVQQDQPANITSFYEQASNTYQM